MRHTTDYRAKPLRRLDRCDLGSTEQEHCGTDAMAGAESAQPKPLQDTAKTEGDIVSCGLDSDAFGTSTFRHRATASARSSSWRHRCLTRRVMS